MSSDRGQVICGADHISRITVKRHKLGIQKVVGKQSRCEAELQQHAKAVNARIQ